jgi:hypothetical protein
MPKQRNNPNQLAKSFLDNAIEETDMFSDALLAELPNDPDLRKVMAASLASSITVLVALGKTQAEAEELIIENYQNLLAAYKKEDKYAERVRKLRGDLF